MQIHPRGNELKLYVPQGGGFDTKPPTGVAFAVIAFLQNPRHSDHVLILAGTGAEGTSAASQFAMNIPALTAALRKCNDPQDQPLQDFELLLKVNMMAGSPMDIDAVACHWLP